MENSKPISNHGPSLTEEFRLRNLGVRTRCGLARHHIDQLRSLQVAVKEVLALLAVTAQNNLALLCRSCPADNCGSAARVEALQNSLSTAAGDNPVASSLEPNRESVQKYRTSQRLPPNERSEKSSYRCTRLVHHP